jgi:hypothetical protein
MSGRGRAETGWGERKPVGGGRWRDKKMFVGPVVGTWDEGEIEG